MIRTNRFFASLSLGLMLLATVSCAKAASTSQPGTSAVQTSSTSSASSERERAFAIVYPIVHPFFEPIGADAESYAAAKNARVVTKAPDSSNAQEQILIMEELIAMKVDGIAIGPADTAALVPVIDKAVDQGIKVITFESEAPGSKSPAFIGTDNYKAGRHLGEVIGKNLNGKGNIMILTGLSTQLSLKERIRGIEEYLKEKYPQIAIVDKQSSEGDPRKAVTTIENMIQANPGFHALIGIDATAGPAAISVWKAKGWKNDPNHMILTFDDMPANVQGLRDGYVRALVAQRQKSWGVQIIDTLSDLADGKEVEKYRDTGSIEITADNVDTYIDEPSYVEK